MKLMTTTNMLCGLLIAALACCASSVAAQGTAQPAPGRVVGSGPPACSAQDKVEVASFTLNPAAPAIGQTVTVRLKIRSKCPAGTADLRVPWEIRKNSTILTSGAETLAPGITKDVTTNWTAAVGTNNFHGNVTLTDGGNNNTSNDVTVTLSPPLVQQALDHVNAKLAGANFSANKTDVNPCEVRTNGGATFAGRTNLFATIVCEQAVGGRGDVEGYSGFTLKNGWRVKNYAIIYERSPYNEGPGKGWSWVSAPPSGTSPYFKIHLWADGLKRLSINFYITIEGPEGTNPYQ